MNAIKLSPSIMCADLLNLRNELDVYSEHNIDLLHIDIMDGHYVPNFTLGIDICKQLYDYSKIPLDIHLMVDDIDHHIDTFCQFEKSWISFHPETTWHPVRVIEKIKAFNCQAGIALSTGISTEQYKNLYHLVDFVVVMTVTPGYSGQKLLPFCLDKVAELKKFFNEKKYQVDIEVDGNVSWENIPKMIDAGATVLVNGTSSIFDPNYTRDEAIDKLKKLLKTEC